MASARKLQLEVDRTLKKIEEGLLEFDEMYDHVQAADGPAKQRLEGELKSEIKKLQKLETVFTGMTCWCELRMIF